MRSVASPVRRRRHDVLVTAPQDRLVASSQVATPPGETTDHSVARVLLDVPLMHLDRPFDYAVPRELSAEAVPGARVKVRFAGRRVNGYILERASTTQNLTDWAGCIPT